MSEVAVALQAMLAFQERSHRDTHKRLDRFEHLVDKRFDGIDERIGEICDFRRTEHSEFRTGIETLTDRLDAKDNQAKGRAQILAPVARVLREHGALLGLVALGAWTATDDIVPMVVSALTPAPVAAIEVLHEQNSGQAPRVQLPKAPPPELRGWLAEPTSR